MSDNGMSGDAKVLHKIRSSYERFMRNLFLISPNVCPNMVMPLPIEESKEMEARLGIV
jgi:hypothetical protein